MKLKITIPYAIPTGYSLRLVLTSATFYTGVTYIDIHSSTYTPKYEYVSSTVLIISNMGPIIIGSTLSVTSLIHISTTSTFKINTYIDT